MIDPTSPRTIGYHLFLEPEGEVKETMSDIIRKLAEGYAGPVFDPHVTLLARIPAEDEREIVKKTQSLASEMKPFPIDLTDLSTQDSFFRALYLKASDTEELHGYHMRAKEIFSIKDDATYVPHLSLYYGLVAETTKEDMLRTFVVPKRVVFTADKLHLYKTEGEVKDWIKIGEYEFGSM